MSTENTEDRLDVNDATGLNDAQRSSLNVLVASFDGLYDVGLVDLNDQSQCAVVMPGDPSIGKALRLNEDGTITLLDEPGGSVYIVEGEPEGSGDHVPVFLFVGAMLGWGIGERDLPHEFEDADQSMFDLSARAADLDDMTNGAMRQMLVASIRDAAREKGYLR